MGTKARDQVSVDLGLSVYRSHCSRKVGEKGFHGVFHPPALAS